MTNFKIGDRVAVYMNTYRYTGVIEEINPKGSFTIIVDPFSSRHDVHPKQCYRLVKKQRRRVWIHKDYLADALKEPLLKIGNYFEFVEVKKK